VDRYCIDQKDHDAKERDINIMGDIYGGSWATIVSLEKGVDIGLPGVSVLRKNLKRRSVRVNGGTVFRTESSAFLRRRLMESAWANRGWTFQEAMLSERLLVFTPDQIILMCDNLIREEWQLWDKELQDLKVQAFRDSESPGGKSRLLFDLQIYSSGPLLTALPQYCREN
jgi:hypothetical protein